MPNDAKLGMVLGVGLVVVIGIVFFRKDPAPAAPPPAAPAATVLPASGQEEPRPNPPQPAQAKPARLPRPALAVYPGHAYRPSSP
jgi:hypothetical protein